MGTIRSLAVTLGLGCLALGAAQARAQCSKDTDCKGDRVCNDAGRCVAPAAPSVVPTLNVPANPYQPTSIQYPPSQGAPQPRPAYGYPPVQQQAPPQYAPGPYSQPVPAGYLPAGQPGSQGGSPYRFLVDPSVKNGGNDIASYRVTVMPQQGGRFTCESSGEQPCTLSLPLGPAHAHFDVVLKGGDTMTVDRDFTVGDVFGKDASLFYANHTGARIVGWCVLGGGTLIGLPIAIDGILGLAAYGSGSEGQVSIGGIVETALGVAGFVVGLSLGLALGTLKNEEELDISNRSLSDARDASKAPLRVDAAPERWQPSFGVVPVRQGAMLVAGVRF